MNFLTVGKPLRHEYIIKKSRFICDLLYCDNLDSLKEHIENIKKEFPDATHHCHGYIGLPGSNELDFKDDGEPSGTAGMPILNALKLNELEGALAIVTRYFGGIKLGATGLSSAYAKATQEAISLAKIVEAVYSLFVCFYIDYSIYEILRANKSLKFDVTKVDFEHQVRLTVAVPKHSFEEFKNLVSGLTSSDFNPDIVEEKYHYYEKS